MKLNVFPNSYSDWQLLANTFQGFAAGTAILVGAIWALFRFWSLREIAQAKVKLEKDYRELKGRQPVVELRMKAEQVVMQDDDSLFITILVSAKNNGANIARLAYEGEPPLGVFSICFSPEGALIFHEQQREYVRTARDPNKPAYTTIVRPGQVQEIPFLIKVTSPGWYFLAFHAVQSARDREALREAGVPDERIVVWTAKKYIQVCRRGES